MHSRRNAQICMFSGGMQAAREPRGIRICGSFCVCVAKCGNVWESVRTSPATRRDGTTSGGRMYATERHERIARAIEAHWPEQIDPGDLGTESLELQVVQARSKLLEVIDLPELS